MSMRLHRRRISIFVLGGLPYSSYCGCFAPVVSYSSLPSFFLSSLCGSYTGLIAIDPLEWVQRLSLAWGFLLPCTNDRAMESLLGWSIIVNFLLAFYVTYSNFLGGFDKTIPYIFFLRIFFKVPENGDCAEDDSWENDNFPRWNHRRIVRKDRSR